jgi:hypothetical protein
MLDDLDRLRTNPHLLELLSHYGNLGQTNRETWQPRLMATEGVEPPELVKLHGELIAFSWVEQNTGQVPICYRITLAGLRAIRQVHGQEEQPELVADTPAKPSPNFRRKKKETLEAVSVAGEALSS